MSEYVENALAALTEHGCTPRREGDRWAARCPAHEDRKPSLAVGEGRDGRALLFCHAGCSFDDVRGALSLAPADLGPRNGNGHAELAVYAYTDEHGEPLFEVVRLWPREFRQRRPGGAWGIRGVRRVLFQLPRVVKAAAAGEVVYVAEGEKDVHALEAAGAVATCNPMGAGKGKWRREYTASLKGAADVVVIADRDEPGRRHAEVVRASLAAAGIPARVVEPAEGKDAADHLAAGHGLDEFVPVESEPTGGAETASEFAASANGRPASLAQVEGALRAYLYLPDLAHVHFALAVAATKDLGGDPLWGMVIGPSSSGKTEAAIRPLDDVAESVDELTAAGLLGWVGNATKGRQVGLLERVGVRGLATIADLSHLLAMSDKGARDSIYALLRRTYDGRVVRSIGTVPNPLAWRGRLTLLTAVTPAVDNYATHTAELGERWLSIRLPDLTPDERERQAREVAALTEAQLDERRAAVRALATPLVTAAAARAAGVRLPDGMVARLAKLALVTCYGRVAVPRYSHGAREPVGTAVMEEPARLLRQLRLLAIGFVALGGSDEAAFALARRACLDSMPTARRRVLKALAAGEVTGEVLTAAAIERDHDVDRRVARTALEDLALVGVCAWPGMHAENADRERSKPWRLKPAVVGLMREAFDGD